MNKEFQNKKNASCLLISSLIAVLLVSFDQLTKYLAVIKLKNQSPFVIISDVFELHYLENQSAAFGTDVISLLQKTFQIRYFVEHPEAFLKFKMLFFAILTVAVVIFLIYIYARVPMNKHFLWINFILILFITGAIGNLIDRVVLNYVIDFFYFKWINFPIFNVADIYVTIAAFLFIILGLFYYREEDFEVIFPKEKNANNKN